MDKLGVLRPLSLPPNVEGIEYGRQRGKVLGKEGEKKGRGGRKQYYGKVTYTAQTCSYYYNTLSSDLITQPFTVSVFIIS